MCGIWESSVRETAFPVEMVAREKHPLYSVYLMWNDQDITLAMILNHMRAMEERLLQRFDAVDHRCKAIDGRFDAVDHRFNLISTQIENIDQRLDAIEIEDIPKRVTHIKKHLGLAKAA